MSIDAFGQRAARTRSRTACTPTTRPSAAACPALLGLHRRGDDPQARAPARPRPRWRAGRCCWRTTGSSRSGSPSRVSRRARSRQQVEALLDRREREHREALEVERLARCTGSRWFDARRPRSRRARTRRRRTPRWCARRPSSRSRWIVTPGWSSGTRNSVMPWCLSSGSVRAPTQYHSAKCAEVVQVFWPLSSQPSPSCSCARP